jgi:hypothetical protein
VTLKPNGREVSSLASLGGLEDYTAPEEVGGAGAVKIVGTVRVVQGSAFELTKYYDAAKTEVDKKEGSADKPFVTAYVRTKNFLDVKNHPVYSSALEEWTREVKKARNNLVDNGKEKADLITQVYNIVGFFSVFQGVVLTAVTQLASGSPPKCQKVWFPILLTLVATLLAVVALSSKFVALGKSEKDATRFRGNHDVSSHCLPLHMVDDSCECMRFCTYVQLTPYH